jgi:hypothetical protein
MNGPNAPPERPRRFGDTAPTPAQRRRRFLTGAFTVAAHVFIFAALLWPRPASPPVHTKPPQPDIQVSLEDTPKPKPPAPPEPTLLAPAAAAAPAAPLRPSPIHVTAPVADTENAPDTSDLLSDSQLSGAAAVGEGGGGGGGSCDIGRAVQQALRRDPMVRDAVENAHRSGKAVMVWNGDWVRTGGQDGKGLSAVREAILWEVGFSPEACRNTRMHGLVLLSLADGATRFAVGTGDWRWSDLLGVRGVSPTR